MQVRGKVRKFFFKESLLTNNIKLRLISFFKLLNLGPCKKKKKFISMNILLLHKKKTKEKKTLSLFTKGKLKNRNKREQ
jgi:hypothetical protein